MLDGEREAKREKADDEEEEMEIDDEEEQPSADSKLGMSYYLASMRHLLHVIIPGSLHTGACSTSNAKIIMHKFTARSNRRCTLGPLLPVRNLSVSPNNFIRMHDSDTKVSKPHTSSRRQRQMQQAQKSKWPKYYLIPPIWLLLRKRLWTDSH
jgi:hypothetical protein